MPYKRTLYKTAYCLTPFERIAKAGILCEGDQILALGGVSSFDNDDRMREIDLGDTYALPGFIDTHIHGAGGFDSSAMASDENADFSAMGKTLASHGVTSFLPTIISMPVPQMISTLSSLKTAMAEKNGDSGAAALGVHVEGPFLNKGKHGSQQPEHIRDIDLGVARELIKEGVGAIKIFTLAPELPGALELIELLRENDIIPSLGHSDADEKATVNAIEAGATRCTHLFNGTPSLHQRDVNLTTIALTDDRVSVELIADGRHLHPLMVDLACRSKPNDKLIGVSDATQGAGLKDGVYHLGAAQINVKDGLSTTDDGVLAGTVMTLETGWHHLITYSHWGRTESAACFTFNPARSIGLNNRGELAPGKKADISFFSNETNKSVMTVRDGRIIYDAQGKGGSDVQ